MQTVIKALWKSIMGGVAISCGAIVYLSLDNHLAGALLFSIGLFTIYTFGLNLFTGKVCYIPDHSPSYLLEVALVFAGNAVGTMGMGYLLPLTKLNKLVEKTVQMADAKLADTLLSTFVMAVLCGLMMCVAVLGYQNIREGAGKYLALILPVMVFILAGFEHSIADLFYFSLAGAWSGKAVLYSVVIALGNALGGVLLPLTNRFTDSKKAGTQA